jgi:hypothetical protein
MKTSKLTKKELTTMTTRLLKPTMGFLLFACAIISLVAMALSTSGIAQAQTPPQTCSVRTLHGLYVFDAHGWNVNNGVAVPKAIVEGIDFNGDGTLTSPFATVSINGVILRFGVGSGSYTVDSDCTGTIAFGGGITYDIFVDHRGGKQLWMIQTGPAIPPAMPGSPPTGPVFEGTAVRVSP